MTGRVAIVSGGTGALGQSVALRFLRDGASVAVPWIVTEEWENLKGRVEKGQIGHLFGARVDVVADPGALAAFVTDVLARHRGIDVLVNAVGGFADGDLASTPLA